MSESSGCKFNISWVGVCNSNPVDNIEYCEKHLGMKCCSCGERAPHDCYETMNGFVCGAPLCDNCEHEINENGTNGGNFKHCRKDAQKFKPWYEREEKQ